MTKEIRTIRDNKIKEMVEQIIIFNAEERREIFEGEKTSILVEDKKIEFYNNLYKITEAKKKYLNESLDYFRINCGMGRKDVLRKLKSLINSYDTARNTCALISIKAGITVLCK